MRIAHPPRRAKTALTIFLAALSAATFLLAQAPGASADPTPTDPKTSVVVSRLPLVGGAGQIQVQPQIGTDHIIGFEIKIPAAGGSWVTKPDIAIPQLGIHCHGLPGPDLHYVCGSNTSDYDWSSFFFLPTGSYQLALPVRRIGSYAGLTGSVSIDKIDAYGEEFSFGSDTFPVVDGTTDPASRAEIRNLDTLGNWDGGRGTGDIAATVTVVPGESVTALDVGLPGPGVAWTLRQTKFAAGLTCVLQPSAVQAEDVHCTYLSGGAARPFPASRFTIVLQMSVIGIGTSATSSSGTAALSFSNGVVQAPDTYNWTTLFDF